MIFETIFMYAMSILICLIPIFLCIFLVLGIIGAIMDLFY
jgi:hypothetical protein